jgi:hypothetical protein
MAARGQFGFGYRATLTNGGRSAKVSLQRDLGPTELARLEEDLHRLCAGLAKVASVQIYLEVPLSRTISTALFDLSQKLELPMKLSVPPLAGHDQGTLGLDFLQTSGRFVEVEVRSDHNGGSP